MANGATACCLILYSENERGNYFPEPDFWQCEKSKYAPKHIETSGITQPPVHGFILWKIYQSHSDNPAFVAFLKDLYPKLLALHQYYYRDRNPMDNGLITIRHPWEPGTDNSPLWDTALARLDIDPSTLPEYVRRDLQSKDAAVHRPTTVDYDRYVYLVDLFRKANYDEVEINATCPFQIVDPMFNSILSWSNECLIELGYALELDSEDLFGLNELTVHSMNDMLWDEEAGLYHAYDVIAQERIETHTHAGLMPMIAGIPDIDQVFDYGQTRFWPRF